MGVADGSTGKARFFTLRQCPDCMCDLPHKRTCPGGWAGQNERNSEIGIIIRNYFPRGRAAVRRRPYQGLAGKGSICLRARFAGLGFHTIGIWQISVAKQHNGRVLTDQNRLQKIPNLKAFPPKFLSGNLHSRRDMGSAASLLQGQGSNSAATHVVQLSPELLERRAGQRRQMLAMIRPSATSSITLVLLVYAYAGTVPIVIPSAYFLVGVGLVSIFVVLSESCFNDRFKDHYLIAHQVGGHVAIQLVFPAGGTRNRRLFLCVAVPDFQLRLAAVDLPADRHCSGRSP